MTNDRFSDVVDTETGRRGTEPGLLPPDSDPTVVWVRRFLRAAGRVRVEPVPPAVRAALESSFAGWAADRRPVSAGRRLLAALVRDGGPGVAVAGARGVTAARHLLFAADQADISVHVRAVSRTRFVLDGIVLRADGADLETPVRLEQLEGAVAATRTDGLGSFRFDELEAGPYQLVVSLDDDELVTPPFDLAEVA